MRGKFFNRPYSWMEHFLEFTSVPETVDFKIWNNIGYPSCKYLRLPFERALLSIGFTD